MNDFLLHGTEVGETAHVRAIERGDVAKGRALTTSRRRRKTSFRQLAVLAHRYVGLVIALFLMVAGLTGTFLAFYHELDRALSPALHEATPPFSGAPMLPPLELREHLLRVLAKGSEANYVPLKAEEGQSVNFFVKQAAGAQSLDDEYFVDPYTGAIIGSRQWGNLSQGSRNLMPFVYRLHYSLALGKVGSYLFGGIALLWTLDCFVGAYLTFPTGRRAGKRVEPGRWLVRWKPSWLIRANRIFSFVFTWHRASGLWVWALLLVFAWSSVGLNLREVYNPVMRAAFGMQERARERLTVRSPQRDFPQISFEGAQAVGEQLMAQEAKQRGFEILEGRRLGYDPERGAYRYDVRSSLDLSVSYPATTVWFDGDTGTQLAFDAPTGQVAGNTITSWLYHLHWGTVSAFGFPYRVLVSMMGLLVATLSLTGVLIWWRKRKRRVERASA